MTNYSESTKKDIDLSHAIINFINACYRGRVAFLNSLQLLNYTTLNNEELPRTEKIIETTNRWIKNLWNGLTLFSTSWKSAETFEAQQALDLLKESKEELTYLWQNIIGIFNSTNDTIDIEKLKMLLACIIRSAYQRENQAKGFLEYGNAFSREDIIELYTPIQRQAAEEVQKANSLLQEFQKGNFLNSASLTTEILDKLKEHSLFVPYFFRVYINDINYQLAIFSPSFTFRSAEIPEQHISDWNKLQTTPYVAGYWSAFFIDPAESVLWTRAELGDPNQAGMWKHAGFSPEEAQEWIKIGFAPLKARLWKLAGYTTDKATPLIAQGKEVPTK
jgi:hypothetical protein